MTLLRAFLCLSARFISSVSRALSDRTHTTSIRNWSLLFETLFCRLKQRCMKPTYQTIDRYSRRITSSLEEEKQHRYLIDFRDAILTTISVFTHTSPMNLSSRDAKKSNNANGSNFSSSSPWAWTFFIWFGVNYQHRREVKKDTNLWSLTCVHFSSRFFFIRLHLPNFHERVEWKFSLIMSTSVNLLDPRTLPMIHILLLTKTSWLTWSSNVDRLNWFVRTYGSMYAHEITAQKKWTIWNWKQVYYSAWSDCFEKENDVDFTLEFDKLSK